MQSFHTEHTDTLCGQNACLFGVKIGGLHMLSNHIDFRALVYGRIQQFIKEIALLCPVDTHALKAISKSIPIC
jgi:hypothetical protein